MNEVACRGCGMKIHFVQSQKTGKMIPLQRVRKIYRICDEHVHETPVAVEVEMENVYVSHFETCPQARDFTKKGRA